MDLLSMRIVINDYSALENLNSSENMGLILPFDTYTSWPFCNEFTYMLPIYSTWS